MLDDENGAPDGWTWVDNSMTPNNGDQTVAAGVLDNSTSTQGPDEWGGFWKGLIGKGFDYAVKKDAVTSGVMPRYGTAASGQPVYMGTAAKPSGISLTGNTLLLLGLGLGVAALFVLKD